MMTQLAQRFIEARMECGSCLIARRLLHPGFSLSDKMMDTVNKKGLMREPAPSASSHIR